MLRADRSSIMLVILLAGATPAWSYCSESPGPGMDWSGCRKMAKVLQDYDLTNGKFVQADLSRSNFQSATLLKADFSKANISHTILRRANLSQANLSGAFRYSHLPE